MKPRADEKPHTIDASILFIDLMNSVALSNTLTLLEYNNLINEYQETLRAVIDDIKEKYPVGEYYLGGDQLAVFFYDPVDAGLHEHVISLRHRKADSPKAAEIEKHLDRQKSRCLYGALRCAVQVKNAWIGHRRNVARAEAQQPVLDVGVGVNTGHVIYQVRGEGQTRIEGFAINFAKRVEGFSRHGNYCKVMLSNTSHETFRSTVVGHSMLKQRAFFEPYLPQMGLLKGLAPGTKIYELKFFHRLAGFSIPPDKVNVYNQIFEIDPTNFWAYSNLINFYYYQQDDITTALALAHRALYSNPESEKIYYDLACINHSRGELDVAEQYCRRCIKLNSEMDIAYDLLADIELTRGASWEKVLHYRAQALALAPDSASNHLDLAVALTHVGQRDAARQHLRRAKQIYPQVMRLLDDGGLYSSEDVGALLELAGKRKTGGGTASKPKTKKRRR